MKWLYRCPACGAEYPIEPGRYLCDECAKKNKPGIPLEGVLECVWKDDDAVSGADVAGTFAPGETGGYPSASSRGAVAGIPLPVEAEFFPPVPVGNTPLWAPERLRNMLGMPKLWLKDDTCNPSGSYKDRASWLVAAFAKKHGIREIALASTGNAASSMACIGAAAGLKITVFLPKTAPAAKRIQVLQYGAELREVDGTYDVAFDRSLEYSSERGVLSRNTAYNPLTIEGKKTASFEIAADLGRALSSRAHPEEPSSAANTVANPGAGEAGVSYVAPDHVFVPAGDGVIVAGIIKGFEDLLRLGRTKKMPKIWVSQAEGSSAIARALATGVFEPRPSDTIADSISVDVPRNGSFVLAKLKKYGGEGVTASDAEILSAQKMLSAYSGLFAEPSSACAFACFLKAKNRIDRDESAVILLTGSGLKDIRSAAKAVGARL